ncbi:dynamin family protein [Nonomuraea sp. GTA35]|uniref:dynamin family protein n=1 Tax=Nonomuraea sp. GTA35 TaxID=1676746 RepID=UPI0035BF5935
MNTAMDDGRQESPGEQTLSFRPVTDEDLDPEVRGDDGPDGDPDGRSDGSLGGGRRDGASARGLRDEAGDPREGRDAWEGRDAREEPPARRPSLFEKPAILRRPPSGDEPFPAFRPSPPASDEPSSERPSLFVKPASLGGPGAAPVAEEVEDTPSSDVSEAPSNDAADESEPKPAPEAQAASDPEATVADSEAASGSEPAADPDPQPHLDPEPASDPEPDPEPEPASDTAPEPESDPALEPRSDTDTHPEPESDTDTHPEPESDTDTHPEPESDTDTDTDTESEFGSASEPESEGEEPGDEQAQPGGKQEEPAEQRAQPGESLEELPAEAAEALMAALDALRESVADLRFGLDLPGSEEARQAQADLLAQLENYVLPRVRTRTAPALIVIAGSTGAGKSTLVNSLAEKNVSRTGVRRPTTGTPVLVCHPEDREWFAEGELLGGLERLDKPSREAGMGSLVIVPTEKLPQGVALLDTPDIDSVVEEHHEIAHRMLDAADLWIFVTTAARYADAPAWNLLRLAKERGARLAIVLSRVQQRSADVVLKHFVRMLTEYGLGDIDRFVIHEAKVTDGRLPDAEVTDLRLWLAELSVDEERRAQAVRETLNGVLNSFRTRVPALAKHLEAQVAFRAELRGDVEAAFLSALSEIDKASRNGSLLHGEVLARWQDFAGSGDLVRSLQLRKRGRAAKQAPERVLAFKAAIRTGLESVIVAAANRACEEVVTRWRHRAELGAKLAEDLDRPSDDLIRHTGRAIASWQEHLSELVRTEGVAKRSVSKLVSFDPESLAVIFMVAMFSGSNGEGVPHRLVNALLGAESLRGIGAKALSDLRARLGMLFDEEAMRYVHALDSAGIPDESVATRLYQATYNLEVAR